MKKTIAIILSVLCIMTCFAACKAGPVVDPEPAESTSAIVTDSEPGTEAQEKTELTVGEKLEALGFSEADFLIKDGDFIELDDAYDCELYTTASYEEVCRACYDACAKASDDGKVLDFWTEEEMEFTVGESEDGLVWYGYNHDGEFCDLAFGILDNDEETGMTCYTLMW